jgi:hypothetical protein
MRTRPSSGTGKIGRSRIRRSPGAFARVNAWLFVASVLSLTTLFGAYNRATAETVPRVGAGGEAVSMTLADAVQVLAREQSAAEQYAVILDRLGKKDPGIYVQGITRYADAKADFDGLIEALKIDLIEGSDPSSSPKFVEALRVAAEKRVAFTNFVLHQIVGSDQGARGSLPSVPGLPDLIAAVTSCECSRSPTMSMTG